MLNISSTETERRFSIITANYSALNVGYITLKCIDNIVNSDTD